MEGFGDAIHAVFPQAEKGVLHQVIQQSLYKTKDLKLVYKADTEELTALDDLEEKWGKKYPASIGSWRNNWTQLSTYFKYPSEIRKLINKFHRKFLRKVTKSKTIFPTDDALSRNWQ